MTAEGAATLARVSTATVCGHETPRGARGPVPELCRRCRLAAAIASRIRQAAKIADDLGYRRDAEELRGLANGYDPRCGR